MNIREAIKIYNELKDDENVIKYSEALAIVLKQLNKEPKKQFYKSSKSNDFYIELPYKRLTMDSAGNVTYKKHGYNFITKRKDNKGGSNYCLSLCGYSKEDIMQRIDKIINEEDKEE